jgi:hypothetical protein
MGPDTDHLVGWPYDEEEEEEDKSAWSVVPDPSDDPQNYYWLDGIAYELPDTSEDDVD